MSAYEKFDLFCVSIDPAALDTSVPEGKNLWVSSWDEQSGRWSLQLADVDTARKVIVVRTDHLSTWAYWTLRGFTYVTSTSGYGPFEVYYHPSHAQPRTDVPAGYTIRDLANDTLEALTTARQAYKDANFTPPNYQVKAIIYNSSGSEMNAITGNIALDRPVLTSLENLREDSAHELFHVFQNQYFNVRGMANRLWWIEGTPDYAAAMVAWNGTLPLPEIFATYFDDSLFLNLDTHAYPMAQFIHYLVTRRNLQFKAMWDTVATNSSFGDNGFAAFQSYVSGATGKTFDQVWADYVDYAIFGSSHLMVDVVATGFKLSDTATSGSRTVSVPSYAAKLVRVAVTPSAGNQTRNIKLSATGLASGTTVEIWQLTNGDRTTAVLKSVLVQDSDSAPFELGDNDSLYAVVINAATIDHSVTVKATSAASQYTYTSTYNGARLSGAGYTGDLALTISGATPFTVFSDDRSLGLWMIWLHSPRPKGLTQSYRACIDVSNISNSEKFEITGYYWGEEFMGGTNRTEGNCVDISVTDSSPAFVGRDAYIEFCYINKSSKSCGSYGIADISISDSN